MLYLAVKAALSGIIIAIVSEVARRFNPRWADRVAAANLDPWHIVAVAGYQRRRAYRSALTVDVPLGFSNASDCSVMPAMLRHGIGFWPLLAARCAFSRALSCDNLDPRNLASRFDAAQ